jgi:threonyl-tRNA synthetase
MQLEFRLPDGSVKKFDAGIPGSELAKALPDGGKALALLVDGEFVDLHTPLRKGGAVKPVLPGTEEGIQVLRHTAAHVMAQAVARIFGKQNVEFAIGPVIDEGFYYDFDIDHAFTPEDLPKIEEEMRKIVREDLPLSRVEFSGKDKAAQQLDAAGKATFKKEIVRDLPDDSVFSFYSQGEFTDLCRGPHVPSTGKVGEAFRLLSVAGAYWRSDEKRKMLQRIYATAFFRQEELEEWVRLKEEAKRRDHRVLGRELGLYKFPDASPGACIWLPKGMVCWREMERLIREKLDARRYVEVRTPILLDSTVWKVTGHMDHYRENMYFLEKQEEEDRIFGMKPMNCPGSAMVFQEGVRSYRELPLRLAEFGLVHRNEKSGVLGGMTRVRAFVQDDAHVYCELEQLKSEIEDLVAFVREVYGIFGFSDIEMYFATRPASSTGTDAMWKEAEAAIESVLKASGKSFKMDPGGGAFYGPKIDFKVRDSIKREWQLATIQVDFSIAQKFGLEYAAKDGTRKPPVVIHRAILGSFERMFGILVEHFAGAFPLWLSPEQVRVIPVSEEKQADACRAAEAALRAAGLRATADLGTGKMGAKIRDAAMQKVNYAFVIGGREAESGQVAVRRRDGHDLGAMPLAEVVEALRREAAERRLDPILGPPPGTPLPERKGKPGKN